MNIFSLHGKWYENNENRLTSNVLFFLDKFKGELLKNFLNMFTPHIKYLDRDIKKAKINFQVYDDGKIPDAEIIIGDDIRILIESKIRSNTIKLDQLREYAKRLKKSSVNYPKYHLVVITQTNQKNRVAGHAKDIESNGIISKDNISCIQWREVIELFANKILNSKNKFMKELIRMFLEEVQNTMYNRIDIKSLPIKELNEVVLTTQRPKFYDMALKYCVFWPYNNFKPSQYVAYYFTKDCPNYGKSLSHIAQIKHIWHDVTIDEVISAIPEFQQIEDFDDFKESATKLYNLGDPSTFAIAITDKPIKLRSPIKYVYNTTKKMNPNILPGKHTTLAKLLTADNMDNLL
ncbi:hypothetical protein [Wukongibacter baidiensis]